MNQRELQRSNFIGARGLHAEQCIALAADASTRRYYRLDRAQPRQLLMEVEPDSPDLPVFIDVSRYLNAIGLSAPTVMHSDVHSGFALIEDFGMETYTNALNSGYNERELYELAVDALVKLHRSANRSIDLPPYDMSALMDEACLFVNWYVPQAGLLCSMATFRTQFVKFWQTALHSVAQRRDALVLRDYHVDNLMALPDRAGVAACGLLDFQDALIGSRAYDLMSLCQDARRDLSPGLEEHLLQRYFSAMPEIDTAQFLRDYWRLAAQRHTKVAGIFQRLAQRDGKRHYLKNQPRVIRRLRQALEQGALHELSELFKSSIIGWETARCAYGDLQ
jgi:aminoglycoside/choline kinase family phosphotransferase